MFIYTVCTLSKRSVELDTLLVMDSEASCKKEAKSDGDEISVPNEGSDSDKASSDESECDSDCYYETTDYSTDIAPSSSESEDEKELSLPS